jgi:hypothetical protein
VKGRLPASAVATLLLALPALAESRVSLLAEVVQASNEGTGVDPGLEKMREQFAKSGISYKSYRRLSEQPLQLALGKPAEVKLPNGKATLTLLSVKGSQSQVSVSLPPLHTTYTLGREGSVYLQAGPHGAGVLILVLTPSAG